MTVLWLIAELLFQELNLDELGEDVEDRQGPSTPTAAQGGASGWLKGRQQGNNASNRFLQPLVEVNNKIFSSSHE